MDHDAVKSLGHLVHDVTTGAGRIHGFSCTKDKGSLLLQCQILLFEFIGKIN